MIKSFFPPNFSLPFKSTQRRDDQGSNKPPYVQEMANKVNLTEHRSPNVVVEQMECDHCIAEAVDYVHTPDQVAHPSNPVPVEPCIQGLVARSMFDYNVADLSGKTKRSSSYIKPRTKTYIFFKFHLHHFQTESIVITSGKTVPQCQET